MTGFSVTAGPSLVRDPLAAKGGTGRPEPPSAGCMAMNTPGQARKHRCGAAAAGGHCEAQQAVRDEEHMQAVQDLRDLQGRGIPVVWPSGSAFQSADAVLEDAASQDRAPANERPGAVAAESDQEIAETASDEALQDLLELERCGISVTWPRSRKPGC